MHHLFLGSFLFKVHILALCQFLQLALHLPCLVGSRGTAATGKPTFTVCIFHFNYLLLRLLLHFGDVGQKSRWARFLLTFRMQGLRLDVLKRWPAASFAGRVARTPTADAAASAAQPFSWLYSRLMLQLRVGLRTRWRTGLRLSAGFRLRLRSRSRAGSTILVAAVRVSHSNGLRALRASSLCGASLEHSLRGGNLEGGRGHRRGRCRSSGGCRGGYRGSRGGDRRNSSTHSRRGLGSLLNRGDSEQCTTYGVAGALGQKRRSLAGHLSPSLFHENLAGLAPTCRYRFADGCRSLGRDLLLRLSLRVEP
eukprot:RCo020093